MSLSINSINCQKPQIYAKSKPSFGASLGDIEPLSDYVSQLGKEGATFTRKLSNKYSHKIAELIFDDEKNIRIDVLDSTKNKLTVKATKVDDEEIFGYSTLKLKNFFGRKKSGSKLAKNFFKKIGSAIDDIVNNPKQIKEDIEAAKNKTNEIDGNY